MRRIGGWIGAALAAALLLLAVGCEKGDKNPKLDQNEQVVLRVVSATPTNKALEKAALLFNKKYPNCTVEYEYLQNYYESLSARLAPGAAEQVDLFTTSNIQAGTEYLENTLELFSQGDALDLSDTHEGLIKNFEFKHGGAERKIYAIPMGAELRGMYVNKTLLASLGLEVPENRAQLLAACKVIRDNGMIPLQANPGNFGQHFLYS